MMLSNKTGLPDDWEINGEPIVNVSPRFTEIFVHGVPGEFVTIRVKLEAEWLLVEGVSEFVVSVMGNNKAVKEIRFKDGSNWKAPE